MNSSEQEKYRPIIEGMIADLKKALSETDSTAAPVAPDNAIGRLSRVDAMQQQQMALESRRQRENHLSRLERALKLIDEGEYGTCPKCEEDIGEKRLNALPDAIFCISCAEEIERK
ncbi:MAG: TraR/DksA family transcriptional regulator [Pyrinomonadaceae bacterium]